MDGEQTPDELQQDDVGLSLEELSQTYARMMGTGETPYQVAESEAAENTSEGFDPIREELIESDQCPISPLSILEAILFVGRPNSSAILPEDIAALMRGVRTEEIDDLADELNRIYAADGHAVRIQSSASGIKMVLDEQLDSVRQRFYGKVRETKLSQSAIDCLALIAYQPGVTREKIEEQRGEPSGTVLNQLVRRELIEIRRSDDRKQNRHNRYFPTKRLLKITGLNSFDELPQVEDWN